MFIVALFTTAKTWKQPKCTSTEEWIKMWYASLYIYIDIDGFSGGSDNKESPAMQETWVLRCSVCVYIIHTYTQWNTTQP